MKFKLEKLLITLNFTTHSGSNYIAKFEDINIKLINGIEYMFNLLNISKEYFDIFKKLYKDKKKYVRGILKPNELYTEIIGIV